MKRQDLWDRMKKAGITQSKRLDCPPDPDLKVVLSCCQTSAKGIIDFLCGLDGSGREPTNKVASNTEKPIL